MATVKSLNKPGMCPDSSNWVGVCWENCENDSACPGDEKCVSPE